MKSKGCLEERAFHPLSIIPKDIYNTPNITDNFILKVFM